MYLLGLLAPLTLYNLVLKAIDVFKGPGGRRGLLRGLALMRSDLLFNLGYASLWAGLFAAARRDPERRIVRVLFHAASALVAFVRAGAHQYYRQTGTTLDWDIVALWLPRFREIRPMLRLPAREWAGVLAALSYAVLGPGLVLRVFERRLPEPAGSGRPLRGPLRLLICALALLGLSARTGSGARDAGRSFARDPVVNLVVTGLEGMLSRYYGTSGEEGERGPAAGARLARTRRTQRRNVVLVHLESTRAKSVTPYSPELRTTPFLEGLAERSLLVERAYTTVPNTLKACVSVNCGIEPPLLPAAEVRRGICVPGLAGLLREQGYRTVFFQSSTERFEDFRELAASFGYEEYYPLESLETEGYERTNYFGYEDDVMLGPSEAWILSRGDGPFVAKYLTGTGHHDYVPPARYGIERFTDDDALNRYLNCLRYQDFFVRNLIEQYRRLGVYEETVFVIYGDHGEGFGEHGRYVHEDNPYEESLRVPLIIHDPRRFGAGERVEGPASLIDVLPTVLDLLGYEVRDGSYPGRSLLRPLPEGRAVFFSCTNREKCAGIIRGHEKYIHHYGDRPDELFDLSSDPEEERDLAPERPGIVEKRRGELLDWRRSLGAGRAGAKGAGSRAGSLFRGVEAG